MEGCSDCCVSREYYPDARFGKVGVLLMPSEVGAVSRLAARAGIRARILPRVGVSDGGPPEALAYQLMGRDPNGDTCPFLDASRESPHGGSACSIYGDRPLACRAYPLESADPPRLDAKCRFCRERGPAAGGLDAEARALAGIAAATDPGRRAVWRYATGVGEPGDRVGPEGWVRVRG